MTGESWPKAAAILTLAVKFAYGSLAMRISVLIVLIVAFACGCSGGGQATSESDQDKIILVTGATGRQGGAVARELLELGYVVRGLTRNTESDRAKSMSELGVEMVQGDFDDEASLLAAMDGVYGVFAVTSHRPYGADREVQHGRQLIAAAKAAGVEHFVFTSVASADAGTGIPHFESKAEIEVYLRDSGINFSIVRPVSFMDNVNSHRDNIVSGVYFDPRDSQKSHQWIAVSDIGFFVGEAFDQPEEWLGRTVEIAGDQMTIAEFVEVLSLAVGVEVHHQQITWSAYEEQVGEETTVMRRWSGETGYQVDIAELRSKYPDLLTYQEYLQSLGWN